MSEALTGVWINIAGSPSTQVLKGATGTYDATWGIIKTAGGQIANGGPVVDQTYVIGADGFPTKYDWKCYSVDPKQLQFYITQHSENMKTSH